AKDSPHDDCAVRAAGPGCRQPRPGPDRRLLRSGRVSPLTSDPDRDGRLPSRSFPESLSLALEITTMNTTTNTTPVSPLAALTAPETRLIGAIDEATARLDAIATGGIEKALARMAEAAVQAAQRIAQAKLRLDELAAGVLAGLEGMAAAV